MLYAQFKQLSTGYVPNTIPPQFSDEHIRPIDLLGSDGVSKFDGRYSLETCINLTFERLEKHIKKDIIFGFDIIQSDSFSSSDKKILYSYRKDTE